MTTPEIYTLSNEFTEKEINNVLGKWKSDNETKSIKTFESLVQLGDSRNLALATTIAKKCNYKDNNEAYYNAYNL